MKRKAFSGRLVRVSGEVQNGPEILTLSQKCNGEMTGLAISTPRNVEKENRPDFSLEEDDVYKFFDLVLKEYGFQLTGEAKAPKKPPRRIASTLVGRIDGPDMLVTKGAKGGTVIRRGYGNMGELRLRLVLKSVESVAISK